MNWNGKEDQRKRLLQCSRQGPMREKTKLGLWRQKKKVARFGTYVGDKVQRTC